MTVLVTGAAGLIGRFVVKELVEAGEHVVSVDRLAPAKLRQNEIYEKTDVGDSLHWFRLFETHKPTSVVHLGAMIAHSSHHDPIEALRVNVMGTGYLFETARLINQPRIVYATSVGVYGAPKLYADLVDEDSPVAPGMIYGATKAMNEATAAHYLRAYGLPSIGLRPTMAYGPGRYVGALGEINRAIKNAVLGEPVTWNQVWTADCVHNPIHVTDIARVFAQAAIGPALPSPIYNVGGEETLTEEEIINTVLKAAPQHGPFAKAPAPVEYLVSYKQLDCGKLFREAGFKPKLNLRDAVKWSEKYYTDATFRAQVDG
jgi:UDP-glucuronate 4-epimerase